MATEEMARPQTAERARARRADRTVPEAQRPEETQALTGETVGRHLSRIEWVLYGAFTLIGAIMRFWDLGSRALHHDESLHAVYSWYLYKALTWNFLAALTGTNPGSGYEYHYDPMMHGPYQFHGNALMYLIFGPGNATARFNAAICGTALIILPLFLRRQLGRVGALILSGLLAFSPAYLYYSRFTREDIYFALWTFVLFVGVMRWLDARGRPEGQRWLYVAAAGYALAWSTKESTFFVLTPILLGFVIGIFVVAYLYQFLAPARPRGKREAVPENMVVAALGDFTRANLRPLLDAFKGTPARAWWTALGIMALIILVLYWPIGDPWQIGFIPGQHGGILSYNGDAFTGGILYWLGQQNVARGGQPWYYYFLVIPLYEQVAVVFGVAGLVYYFMHKPTRLTWISGAAFLAFTLLTLFAGPGLPGVLYKLLALLMIASGVVLLISRPRAPLINLLLWWTVVTWALYTFAGEKMPWLTLHILLPTFCVAALYLGHLFRAPRWSRKWLVAATLLALTALVSFRSSVALAYADGANPTEMLVYTQTSPDVPMVSDMMHAIAAKDPTAQFWVDQADSWPFVWYLRDLAGHYRWGLGNENDTTAAGNDAVSAAQQRDAVIVVGSEDHDNYFVGQHKLGALANYVGYKFRFRWWFPEDYKDWETSGPGGFLAQALQPSTYAHLFAWWATRTPFDQQAFETWANVYPFYVYVRKDLVRATVPASWATARARIAGEAAGPLATPNDVPAALTRAITPLLAIDGATLPRPVAALRDVAVDRSGAIYLTDTGKQRVIELDRAGRYVTSWGSPGSGPGQFNPLSQLSPMGIAIAPNGHLYVTDTWNHRIEEFTATGRFVRAFGGPNPGGGLNASATSFFGPRQIAVAPNGNLYIADTGNERIQVYSPTGRHLFNIGGGSHKPETAPGRFDEPSGVAVDQHGTVYVADYWDRRIQVFAANGTPLRAYTISGWPAAPGDYQEPYLAVDTHGHLFATDAPGSGAHAPHVLELDAATGKLLAAYGGTGLTGALTTPSGIAVGPDGMLYIADTGANKLFKIRVR